MNCTNLKLSSGLPDFFKSHFGTPRAGGWRSQGPAEGRKGGSYELSLSRAFDARAVYLRRKHLWKLPFRRKSQISEGQGQSPIDRVGASQRGERRTCDESEHRYIQRGIIMEIGAIGTLKEWRKPFKYRNTLKVCRAGA